MGAKCKTSYSTSAACSDSPSDIAKSTMFPNTVEQQAHDKHGFERPRCRGAWTRITDAEKTAHCMPQPGGPTNVVGVLNREVYVSLLSDDSHVKGQRNRYLFQTPKRVMYTRKHFDQHLYRRLDLDGIICPCLASNRLSLFLLRLQLSHPLAFPPFFRSQNG